MEAPMNVKRRQSPKGMNRRSFLKGVVASGAATLITPRLLRAAAATGTAPSSKVNIAICGIGNRGGDDFKELQNTGLANFVALCDTEMGDSRTQTTLRAA